MCVPKCVGLILVRGIALNHELDAVCAFVTSGVGRYGKDNAIICQSKRLGMSRCAEMPGGSEASAHWCIVEAPVGSRGRRSSESVVPPGPYILSGSHARLIDLTLVDIRYVVGDVNDEPNSALLCAYRRESCLRR